MRPVRTVAGATTKRTLRLITFNLKQNDPLHSPSSHYDATHLYLVYIRERSLSFTYAIGLTGHRNRHGSCARCRDNYLGPSYHANTAMRFIPNHTTTSV